MAVTTPDTDRLRVDTQIMYTKTIWNQIEDRNPVIRKMRKTSIMYTGGSEVQIPVTIERNNQTQHYGIGEQMNSSTESKRSYAKHTLIYTQTPMKYDVRDEVENNGALATINTISAEVDSAQTGQIYTLSRNAFGLYGSDSTITNPTSKEPLSLNAALTHDITIGGRLDYGGITRSTQTDFWNGVSGDGDTITDATTQVGVSYAQWDHMVDSCLKHGGKRNRLMAIAGSKLFHKWKSLVRAKENSLDTSGELFKVGFASFSIDNVEIVLDDNCPADTFYMLDMDTWQWYISSKRNFKVTDFKWQGDMNDGIDEYLGRVLLSHTGMFCNKPRNNYFTTNMV